MLDERLEKFRNPTSGEIVMNSQEAQEVLVNILYTYYRNSMDDPSIKIEALRSISETDSEEKINFADSLKIAENTRKDRGQRKKDLENMMRTAATTVTPKEPKRLI